MFLDLALTTAGRNLATLSSPVRANTMAAAAVFQHESVMITYPRLRLLKGAHRRLQGGHPWIYSNEVVMDAPTKAIAPGTVVMVESAGGDRLALAHFNPRTLIAARVLDAPEAVIDGAWFRTRIGDALHLRSRLVAEPFYRLVHAEADGLPGLIIDRFGDVVVVQPNTAGMDAALPMIVETLDARTIVVRGDSSARTLEGLPERVETVRGSLSGAIEVREGGVTFLADPAHGQKTGWFFDQRDNRAFAAGLVARAPGRVLDLYTHTGGFAVACAKAGATEVLGVDSSALALDLAKRAAEANGLSARFEKHDVFDFLAANQTQRFDIVIADPPAFVKSRKDMKAGLQGYRKLARLTAPLVAPGGFLMIASCSHNASAEDFTAAVVHGVADAGRTGRIVRNAGAGPDHPVHTHLPESAYLKFLALALK